MKLLPDWSGHGISSLHESGDFVPTGQYEAKYVLWSEPGDHYDDRRRVMVVVRWHRHGTHATSSLEYMGTSKSLWTVRARSMVDAVRQVDSRMKRCISRLITAGIHAAYQRRHWGCVYRDGQPLASYCTLDHNLVNSAETFGSSFITVERRFDGELYTWEHWGRGSAWFGSGMPRQSALPYWIAA